MRDIGTGFPENTVKKKTKVRDLERVISDKEMLNLHSITEDRGMENVIFK